MYYYKKNIGDYHKKAGRLSMLQHGAYTLLIDSCYDREVFPTLDDAINWTWACSTEEIEAVEFVLKRFFTLEDGLYTQKHIKEDLEKYHKNSETNKRIALEREAKRRGKSTKRVPTVNEAPPNQEPLTNNQEPLTKEPLTKVNKAIALPEIDKVEIAFDLFWEAGMRKVGRKKAKAAFEKKFKENKSKLKISSPDEPELYFANHLVSDIKERLKNKQFGFDNTHPTSYLNGNGWTDEKHDDSQTTESNQPIDSGGTEWAENVGQPYLASENKQELLDHE